MPENGQTHFKNLAERERERQKERAHMERVGTTFG